MLWQITAFYSILFVMNIQDLLKEALCLKPQDRILIINALLKSLDKKDPEAEAIWNEEIERRSKALDNGTLKTNTMEVLFPKLIEQSNCNQLGYGNYVHQKILHGIKDADEGKVFTTKEAREQLGMNNLKGR